MLTKNDLQQIRVVVREEVHTEVKKQLKPVTRKINRIQKDLNYVIGDYDERIVHAHRRIDKLDERLGLSITE